MLTPKPTQFALTYSVTLSPRDLETTLVVRNTGTSNFYFQTLFHTYLKVEVSPLSHRNASPLSSLGDSFWLWEPY